MPAAPPPPEKTEAELAAEAAAERQKADAEAKLSADQAAFAAGLRGRRAFLSPAGEKGYTLGGV